MNRFKNRFVAVLICLLFASNGSVFAQQPSTVSDAVPINSGLNPSPGSRMPLDAATSPIASAISPYNISVPEEFGQVEDVFQGDPSSPLIVHVQNVHANYEAQVNIKNILKHLVDQYQFSLIQLEGAVSKLDPTILQPSYLKDANLKLVDFLMREGRITGADAYAVETEKPVELNGIEDYSLYMENLKMFKTIYKHQEDLKPYFDEVHRLILGVGPRLLKPELLDFTRKTEEFSTDKIDLLDYLLYLNKASEKNKLVSLNDLKEMVEYPNLTRLMRLHNLEQELNKAGLKKETEAIKAEFQKKMPDSPEVTELLSHLDESTKGTSPRSYFLELTKKADEAKIDFVSYPAFRIFAEFLIHQDEIDHRALFAELKQFEQMLQEKLFSSEDEKLFLSIIDKVGLLEQFFKLEMSREKIALYLKDREEVKPSWILEKLDGLAQTSGVTVNPIANTETFDSYMSEVEYYYQLILKRDEVFIDKILTKTKSMSLDKTIIVTGGFHKDGLIDYFRKEKISYVIINPKVDVKEGNEKYLKVMLGEDEVAGSVFAGTFALELLNFIDARLRGNIELEETIRLYGAVAALTRSLNPTIPDTEFIQKLNDVINQNGSNVKLIIKSVEGQQFITVNFIAAPLEGSPFEYKATFNTESQRFEVTKAEKPLKTNELNVLFQTQPPQNENPLRPVNPADLQPLQDIALPFTPTRNVASLQEILELSRVVGTFVPVNRPVETSDEEALQALLGARSDNAAEAARKISSQPEETQITSNLVLLRLKEIAALTGTAQINIPRNLIEQAVEELGPSRQVNADDVQAFIQRTFAPTTAQEGEPRIMVVPILASMSAQSRTAKLEFLAKLLQGKIAESNVRNATAFLYVSDSAKAETRDSLTRLGIIGSENLILVRRVLRTDDIVMSELRLDLQTGNRFLNEDNKLRKAQGLASVTLAEMLESGAIRVLIDNDKPGQELGADISNLRPNVVRLYTPDQSVLAGMTDDQIEAVSAFGLPVLRILPTKDELEHMGAVRLREGVFQAINGAGFNWAIDTAKLGYITELYQAYKRALALAAAA